MLPADAGANRACAAVRVCAGWGGEGAGRAINQRFHKQPFQEHVPMLLLQGLGAARQQGLGGSMLPADAGANRACAAVRVCVGWVWK